LCSFEGEVNVGKVKLKVNELLYSSIISAHSPRYSVGILFETDITDLIIINMKQRQSDRVQWRQKVDALCPTRDEEDK